MSGLKGRRISADMFAMMLKVSAGQLVLQPGMTSLLRGLTLPPYRIEGGKLELDRLHPQYDV